MPTVYATAADFARLGLPTAATEGMDEATITGHLEAASARADDYLAAQFRLPLTVWTDSLRENVCSIAAWTLLKTRGFNPEGMDEAVETGFKEAIRWFERVASGLVALRVTDTSATSVPFEPAFESDDLRGW
jgi:phage gp36-like protein